MDFSEIEVHIDLGTRIHYTSPGPKYDGESDQDNRVRSSGCMTVLPTSSQSRTDKGPDVFSRFKRETMEDVFGVLSEANLIESNE